MAYSRKDSKGRVLRKGESQREKYYIYQYMDGNRQRRVVYAKDLPELREKEKRVLRDIADGIDNYAGDNTTLNLAFDRYIESKEDIKQSTRTNYKYMYDHYVRSTFGKRSVTKIRYSDVKYFYNWLMKDHGLKLRSVELVHTVLHPVFTMLVRDEVIRKNPSDGVMAELKKNSAWRRTKRHALTLEQQQAFMNYTMNSPIYSQWAPLFTVLLGTGCRIGEVLGLRWEDLDFEAGIISINHNLIYKVQESGKCELHITTPKTEAGVRKIPMLNLVREAFLNERKRQKDKKYRPVKIDGYTNFVFVNRVGNVHKSMTVNRAIKCIYEAYNEEEKETAMKEGREPILIPHFTCHILRHTFCTRYCENENNLKVIQEIMGHADIGTTMDVYAEATESKKKESFTNLEKKVKII